MPNNLKTYLSLNRKIVDRALQRALPKANQRPRPIHQAMRYSVFAGGKRLRPILVILGAEACGGNKKSVLPVACAMECIHTYSLIHDDLPAMDDDDLRRGRPTNHKVFGEDIAILAGDALLTHAFRLVRENARLRGIPKNALPQILEILTQGAGTPGMIGGQVADIKYDKGRWRSIGSNRKKRSDYKSPEELLRYIHHKKTAALISASLEAGGCLAGGTPAQLKALRTYGHYIGLAFQVRDDILDRIGDKKKLGKKGSDQSNRKLTYPALYGLAQSEKMAHQYLRKAQTAIRPLKRRSSILRDLSHYILTRDR